MRNAAERLPSRNAERPPTSYLLPTRGRSVSLRNHLALQADLLRRCRGQVLLQELRLAPRIEQPVLQLAPAMALVRNADEFRLQTIQRCLKALGTFSFQSGADGFLLRPFHAKELVAAIEDVVSVPYDELPVYRRDQLKVDG